MNKVQELENKVNLELSKFNRILAPGHFEKWFNELKEKYKAEIETDALVNQLLSTVGQGLAENKEKEKVPITSDALKLLQKIDREVV